MAGIGLPWRGMGEHRRKRRPTSTASYASMLLRMIRAYAPRIGRDPADGLARLREIESELTNAVNVGLMIANREHGHSVNELAATLGISKQAIHKRIRAGEAAAEAKTPRPVRSAARRAAPRELENGS